MKETTKARLVDEAIRFGRTLSTIVVASFIIVGGLVIGFAGQSAREAKVLQDTLNANLALACVISLPVPESGRDPELVELCFTQYELTPPITHN